ncbi:hypothetical protein ACJMK2_016920 [Sinanodonta woodiana]|uniref:EF-hand domain-containing protein n=1 Tax=Sinanodonta woodiana TaxID=1069815 RepID=A0ABD3UYP2_SINWO
MCTGTCSIILVLTVVLLDGAVAWRFRLPRIHIPVPVCQEVCHTECPNFGDNAGWHPAITAHLCHLACRRVCKRSIPELAAADDDYQVVPMSRDFQHYDLNDDKLISPEEFANAQKVPLDEVYNVFQFADINGDDKLDAEELAAAPFLFESEKTSGENGNIQEKRDRKPETEQPLHQ